MLSSVQGPCYAPEGGTEGDVNRSVEVAGRQSFTEWTKLAAMQKKLLQMTACQRLSDQANRICIVGS